MIRNVITGEIIPVDPITTRRHALDLEEQGWAGTFLVEPLTALAGGVLGGMAVSVVAWRLAWAHRRRAALLDAARAVRR